ncbi:hypothetical protein Bca101_013604 [Brassica carinata]
MDIFCWNIRGFNDSVKRRGFRKWFKKNKPIFGGLVETHVQPEKATTIVNRSLPGWSFENNYAFSNLGKIWLLWHPSVQVTVLSKSLQVISCRVKLPLISTEFIVSIVYGSNNPTERRLLWSEIESAACSSTYASSPWILLGDFNEVICLSEHSNGDNLVTTRGMREFKECLQRCDLSDLSFRGNSFTWTNSHVSKKLDRILVNDEWLQCFPDSLGIFGELGISDHAPACVFTDQLRPKQKRPFKFFAHLNQHPEFVHIIRGCWNGFSFEGSLQLCVSRKLKELKSVIRTFSRENFSNLEKRVAEAFDTLVLCQQVSLASPSSAAALAESEAHRKWVTLATAEDSFLRQRSRIQWTSEGDAPTAFYHRSIKSRRDMNQIDYLMDNDDTIIDSLEAIKSHAVGYFSTLLGGPEVQTTSTPQDISNLVHFKCSPESISVLAAPFTDLEIQQAFLSLPKSKAPGPDGYPGEFFKAHWSTVGRDMIDAVAEFFSSGYLLQQWNSTIISLVPKKTNASRITDFRPISCCNSVYKVISKLLSNRLKTVLPQIISNAQSAFIPGRLLVENVLLATELVQGYNWKSISKRCMLKVDLKKAFDTVNWSFIMNTLEALDFPPIFRHWIHQCISTTRFSVAINGELCGYFKGTKGLRQGDPLSPYLFVLCIEVFSQLLNSKYTDGSIGYHPMASNPSVSHLAFADDIMVFFDGEKSSLEIISDTFEEFSGWSGLTMNKQKTELYTAGLTQPEIEDLTSLGFTLGSLPIRYLGLPLMHCKLKLSHYRPLLDKLTSCFTCWANRALSYAGRLQLLSSVIYGTINFWTSAFLLPKGCIKKIQALCSSFLWSGQISGPVQYKVAWSTVCLPMKEGGLGLRDFSTWNKTLCLRLIWLLFENGFSLWAEWMKANRMRGCSFWSCDIEKAKSWTWKSLLYLRPLAYRFLRAKLGDGKLISFWWDYWSPFGPLIEHFGPDGPRQLSVPINACVSEVCNDSGWTLRGARSELAEELQIYLTTVPLPSSQPSMDSYFWLVNEVPHEKFTTKHTWEVLRHQAPHQHWSSYIWFKGAIPKHSFLMWLVQLDRLPTRSRLVRWGLNISTACCLCDTYTEDRDHLFLRCEWSSELWTFCLTRLGYGSFGFHTWTAFTHWLSSHDATTPMLLKKLVALCTIYSIWSERNKRLHDSISRPAIVVFKILDRFIRDAILSKRNQKQDHNLMQHWLVNE